MDGLVGDLNNGLKVDRDGYQRVQQMRIERAGAAGLRPGFREAVKRAG